MKAQELNSKGSLNQEKSAFSIKKLSLQSDEVCTEHWVFVNSRWSTALGPAGYPPLPWQEFTTLQNCSLVEQRLNWTLFIQKTNMPFSLPAWQAVDSFTLSRLTGFGSPPMLLSHLKCWRTSIVSLPWDRGCLFQSFSDFSCLRACCKIPSKCYEPRVWFRFSGDVNRINSVVLSLSFCSCESV